MCSAYGNQEKADTRVLVYLLHALQALSLELVNNSDTAVVAIHVCNSYHIKVFTQVKKHLEFFKYKTGGHHDVIQQHFL